MDRHSIIDIARALSARYEGDGSLTITRASEPVDAGRSDLAVAMDAKYADSLASGDAQAAILWEGADWQGFGLKAAIFVQRPRLAMAALTNHLKCDRRSDSFVHPSAVIAPDAKVGSGARIEAFAVINAGVTIGENVWVGAHVTIDTGSVLGSDCVLRAGCRVGENVVIGDRFIGHSGCVIGADGFSFVTAEKSSVEVVRETLGEDGAKLPAQTWIKIQSLGGVEIGDDVEIGANSNIDAGTIQPTSIGNGTKIDALVQVGHNVRVGRDCLLCAHVAIGGSAQLGDGVVLGGQAGVADNINVGDGVIAGGGSKILSNVPNGRAVLGYPAIKMKTELENYKLLRRLPRILQKLRTSQKSVPKSGPKD